MGAIAAGRCAFTVHGRVQSAGEGELVLIAPGQVHTGGTSDAPLAYRMAYIDPAWFADHERALFGGGASLAGPVIADAALCGRWLDALTPESLGMLVALYEHSVYLQSVLWGINAFDQFGVELGKQVANRLLPALNGGDTASDPVTQALLAEIARPL